MLCEVFLLHGTPHTFRSRDRHVPPCRCQLSVRVRGGHHGGAADAAWDMLRRNGIVPTQDGNHADASGGSVSGDVGIAAERAQELKAVLDLGQRDSVRRLASKVKDNTRSKPFKQGKILANTVKYSRTRLASTVTGLQTR